ncbi:MAG TPA: ubiquinone/menaquinone biosynthesis methyltransferase, partial [Candidatus Limnocylindria bacterium]
MSDRPTPERVVDMFDRIAPRYDAMNTVMTGGLDAIWRRNALDAAALQPGDRVLDVATGTGKLALAAAVRVKPGGEVVGLDPAAEMLARARRAAAGRAGARLTWVQADAGSLPFAAGTFDAVTIGFGLRNLPDVAAALREMARVAAPGGRVVVLEIATPSGGLSGLLFRTWFQQVIPRLGALAGGAEAYRYLPESVARYPAPPRIAELMADAGLRPIRWRWLIGGMV